MDGLAWDVHPRSLGQMINVARFYCYRNGVTWIEDCDKKDATKVHRRLLSESVVIYHSVVV